MLHVHTGTGAGLPSLQVKIKLAAAISVRVRLLVLFPQRMTGYAGARKLSAYGREQLVESSQPVAWWLHQRHPEQIFQLFIVKRFDLAKFKSACPEFLKVFADRITG